jgi:leader peptidase (prepilin peptidase) / N-methyltransferase
LAAGLGLIFGSFATAIAYRIPRKESLGGRSRCPECGATISAAQNVPLFSYLFLRGRCRNCGVRIHWRYPLIELFSAILFVAALLRFELTFRAAVYAALFWVLPVLTAIDLEHKLLPNRLVYPAFITGWVLLTVLAFVEGTPRALIDAAIGMLIFGGFFFLVAFIYPAGMGGGDVKLAFVLGTFLGYLGGFGLVLLGMFVSFLIGGIVGVAVMAITGGGRKMQVPFGPFMAVGTLVTIFCGDALLDLYLGSF